MSRCALQEQTVPTALGPLRADAIAAFLGPTTMRERPEVVEAVPTALARNFCLDYVE